MVTLYYVHTYNHGCNAASRWLVTSTDAAAAEAKVLDNLLGDRYKVLHIWEVCPTNKEVFMEVS